MVVPEKLLMKKIKKREKIKKQLVAAKQQQNNEAEPAQERELSIGFEVRYFCIDCNQNRVYRCSRQFSTTS